MRVIFNVGIVILGLCSLAGCASSQSGSSSDRTEGQEVKGREMKQSALQKGMTAEELRAAWGQPEKIAPMESTEGTAEVWTYRTSIFGGVREVQKGVITEMRRNPTTGMDEATTTPVLGTERIMIERTFELLMFDAKLVEWKQSDETRRTYN